MSLADDVLHALPGIRAQAESLMTEACTITRAASEPIFNEDTGNYEDATPTTLYSGKCRVRSGGSMGAERDAGDQFAIVNRVKVSVPVGLSGFRTGDMVTITVAPHNPQIVNARYVVRSVDDQSHASALRLECEET